MSELNPSGDISTKGGTIRGTPEDTIAAVDTFWPAVSIRDYRDHYRDDTTRADAQIRRMLTEATQTVATQISTKTIEFRRAGNTNAADLALHNAMGVPLDPIERYRSAVYHFAKSLSLETWGDFDTTGRGVDKIEQIRLRIIAERRLALQAIADLTGAHRAKVLLI